MSYPTCLTPSISCASYRWTDSEEWRSEHRGEGCRRASIKHNGWRLHPQRANAISLPLGDETSVSRPLCCRLSMAEHCRDRGGARLLVWARLGCAGFSIPSTLRGCRPRHWFRLQCIRGQSLHDGGPALPERVRLLPRFRRERCPCSGGCACRACRASWRCRGRPGGGGPEIPPL